jgi:hypothetical protein
MPLWERNAAVNPAVVSGHPAWSIGEATVVTHLHAKIGALP